jgi:hypothetical protein
MRPREVVDRMEGCRPPHPPQAGRVKGRATQRLRKNGSEDLGMAHQDAWHPNEVWRWLITIGGLREAVTQVSGLEAAATQQSPNCGNDSRPSRCFRNRSSCGRWSRPPGCRSISAGGRAAPHAQGTHTLTEAVKLMAWGLASFTTDGADHMQRDAFMTA